MNNVKNIVFENVVEKDEDIYKISVKKTDAVLILSKNMDVNFIFEDKEDHGADEVNDNIVVLSAIITRLKADPNFIEDLLKFFEAFGSIDDFGITKLKQNDEITWN
jgi:general stress protein 26